MTAEPRPTSSSETAGQAVSGPTSAGGVQDERQVQADPPYDLGKTHNLPQQLKIGDPFWLAYDDI